jgi:uncharacterized protein
MPGGNGTGPDGQGPGMGRGGGPGQGRGKNRGDRPGSGPGGNCVCLSCGKVTAHQAGTPCSSMKCPECGGRMTKQ